jgi:hypothetical protein
VVVSRCGLDGDVTALTAPIRVTVEIAVVAARRIVPTTDAVRLAVRETLATQTDLTVQAVDVVVRDLIVPADAPDAPNAPDVLGAPGASTDSSPAGTDPDTHEEQAR